jgi:hypothetical protein
MIQMLLPFGYAIVRDSKDEKAPILFFTGWVTGYNNRPVRAFDSAMTKAKIYSTHHQAVDELSSWCNLNPNLRYRVEKI